MTLPALLLDIQAAIEGREALGPRRPWLAWTVVALCRQRLRQDWLAEVAAERLHEETEQSGEVPGLPSWSFYFHGNGLCLSGPNHEVLDVNFHDGDDGPQTIDPYFFIHRILGLKDKPNVEFRMTSWIGGSTDLMAQALKELRREGVVQHPSSEHVFHLHPWLESRYRELGAIDFDDAQVWLSWTRALGGDNGDSQEQDASFSTWAQELLSDPSRARAVEGLAKVLPTDVVVRVCQQLMAGPIDSVNGRCVRILRGLGLPPNEHADALLARLDPAVHNPFSAVQLAEWLFEFGRTDTALQLVQRFSNQRVVQGFRGNPFDDDYALLALRFVQSEAMLFVRQALRSRTPNALEKTAALLSVLDEPWCRAELLHAAEEHTEPATVRFLVGCLMHSTDANTRAAAKALMPPPPDFSETHVGYSYEEVHFLNLRENVEHRRSTVLETAALLRPH